jgi:hypothetical protein
MAELIRVGDIFLNAATELRESGQYRLFELEVQKKDTAQFHKQKNFRDSG